MQEYDTAIQAGFYAYSHFNIKMSAFFEHQCGLLNSLQTATAPKCSFIADLKVGIVDLELMPFSLFPSFGDHSCTVDASVTYQSKVSDGTIVVKRLRQNLLQIEEPEGMGQQLIEVARADFSGDGIEDILLLNTVMRLTAHSVSAAFGS